MKTRLALILSLSITVGGCWGQADSELWSNKWNETHCIESRCIEPLSWRVTREPSSIETPASYRKFIILVEATAEPSLLRWDFDDTRFTVSPLDKIGTFLRGDSPGAYVPRDLCYSGPVDVYGEQPIRCSIVFHAPQKVRGVNLEYQWVSGEASIWELCFNDDIYSAHALC